MEGHGHSILLIATRATDAELIKNYFDDKIFLLLAITSKLAV